MVMSDRPLPTEPLYVAEHAARLAPRGEPGRAPFVRGSLGPGARWVVARRLDAADARAAERLSEDARSGVEAFWIAGDAAPSAAWASLGRSAGATPLVLCEGRGRAREMFEALRTAGAERVAPLADPIGEVLSGAAAADATVQALFDAAASWIEGGATAPDRRALAVPAASVHEAGGHAVLEIGFALASAVEMARRLDAAGVPVERALGSIALVVAAGVEPYEAIAKLRALRLGWSKVALALGASDVPWPMIIGQSSRRAMALADMPSNAIRTTVEAFALAVGGADVIVTRAFDALAASPSPLGQRVALATQLVLRDESHLGEVSDAAGGSYYLEARTDELARAGWAEMQAIEAEGGVIASIAAGAFVARVRAAGDALYADTNRRKRVIVGVTDFAAGAEPLAAPAPEPAGRGLAPIRPAEVFERVRGRAASLARAGKAPEVRLVLLGPEGTWRPREDFARRFFEAGGFTVSSCSLDAALASPPAGGAFVLCGTDETYTAEAVTRAQALASAGAASIVLAGKPGALEADLRAAGLAHAIHLGCDAPAVLNAVLDRLAGGAS